MLVTRIASRVLSRMVWFSWRGFFVGAQCGVPAGAVAGAAIAVSWTFVPSYGWMNFTNSVSQWLGIASVLALAGAFYGVFLGAICGALAGTLAFATAGALTSKSEDGNSVLDHVAHNVSTPIFWITCVASLCSLISAFLIANFAKLQADGKVWIFWICSLGAIGGFIAGNFYGAIGNALSFIKEREAKSSTR